MLSVRTGKRIRAWRESDLPPSFLDFQNTLKTHKADGCTTFAPLLHHSCTTTAPPLHHDFLPSGPTQVICCTHVKCCLHHCTTILRQAGVTWRQKISHLYLDACIDERFYFVCA